jgi:PAS domain S-box-containing protein
MITESGYFVFATLSTTSLVCLLPIAWRRRQLPGVVVYMMLSVLVAAWVFLVGIEAVQLGAAQPAIWGKIKYIGMLAAPVAWLVFTLSYAGSKPELQSWHIALLLGLPALTLVTLAMDTVALDNTIFRLVDPVRMSGIPTWMSVIYVLQTIYAYFLVLTGGYIMLRMAIYSPVYHFAQRLTILLAIVLPVAANIISNFGLSSFAGMDITPLAFAVGLLLIAPLALSNNSAAIQVFAPETLLNKLPDGVIVLNQDNRVLMVNLPLSRLLKHEPKTILGQPIHNFIPVEWLGGLEEENTGRIHESFLLDGHYLEISRAPLRDKQGKIKGRLISLRDNTARKQAELALHANERRYRALFENSHDAIFIIDLTGKILIANTQAAHLMQMDVDDLVGTEAQHYLRPPHITQHQTRQQQLLNGETLPVYEQTFVRTDGTILLTEVNLTLVRETSGKPIHLQMIVRDIRQRKQNEFLLNQRLEQFAVLRQVETEINSTLDIEQVVKFGLAAAVHLSGADAGFIALTQDETVTITAVSGEFSPAIVGQPIHYDTGIVGRALLNQEREIVLDVTTDPDYQEDIPTTRALMAFPFISHDRLLGLINLETAEPSRFTQDIVDFIQLIIGRLAVAVDNAHLYAYVTKQLQETQALNGRLERLQQTQRDMIRIANHDLKNPLSVLLGYLEIFNMDRDKFEPLYQEAVDMMRRSADRMNQIMDDILTLERIEQRATGGTYTRLNLLSLVQQAMREFQPQANAKALHFTLENPTLVPEGVIGDAAELYEAVVNFVSNAIKYTPEGGSVTVRLEETSDALRFEVQDTGYGIPEEQQAHLFQPFFRVGTNATKEIEGTGLGLHLVKNIIERHGGSIHFRSIYGKGSTFGFQLPKQAIS